MLACTLHRGPAAFAALEPAWRRVQDRANPFTSWEWNEAWVASAGVEPWVLIGRGAAGEVAALWALQRVRRVAWRQLEFLGQGSGADENDLLGSAAGAATAPQLAAWLERQPGWDVLRLESAAGQCGLANCPGISSEAGPQLPFLPLPESFDGLLAGHSPNFRAEVRRRRRNLERRAPGLRLDCLTAPAAVGAGLEELFRLHNLRRRQKGDAGIFENPRLCAFHRRAAPALAAAGMARLYCLRHAGATLAALYGLDAGSRFLYFQSGFDPAWSDASPGTVLLSLVIEDCIARRQRQFEFLRGDESYKYRWTTQQRSTLTLRACRGAGHVQAWLRAAWQARGARRAA